MIPFPAVAPAQSTDPRLQRGAYITDGDELYRVERATLTPSSFGPDVLVVEDCRSNTVLELDVRRITTTCALVRAASIA